MQCKMRRMMLLMAQLQQETNTLTDLGTAASGEAWIDQKQRVTNLKVSENIFEMIFLFQNNEYFGVKVYHSEGYPVVIIN